MFLYINYLVPSNNCQEQLGVEDGTISDNRITASSWQTNSGPSRARLNTPTLSGTDGAWVPSVSDMNQWIQAELGDVKTVTGVLIQGRSDTDQWVTAFMAQYSLDGENWYYVQDAQQDTAVVSLVFFLHNHFNTVWTTVWHKKPFDISHGYLFTKRNHLFYMFCRRYLQETQTETQLSRSFFLNQFQLLLYGLYR